MLPKSSAIKPAQKPPEPTKAQTQDAKAHLPMDPLAFALKSCSRDQLIELVQELQDYLETTDPDSPFQ
ncbi:hypothetical protein RZS08_17220 [Arthrospira platensis SPKY1]|nr:hypothetical protein [Arthrospira platensis SPKY1]